MGLQDIIRWFVPREDQFYLYLEGQADKAHEGALALHRFTEGSTAAAVRDAVQDLEHQGDKLSHEMEEALAKTFVTPIDREDLQKLSAELDDILDLANGAIRAAVLYGVQKPTEPMGKLMGVLVKCTGVIKETMPNLRKNAYAKITESTHTLRKLEKEGDAVYRESLSALFSDEAIDAKRLLREKEVLEDLENAVDHCETVGETLAHLAVKHG
jgi:uncharacterized protein Yka (UPF0111/DUF47 family)